MKKIIQKSYVLTFSYTGDSIADTILIHDVILINADSYNYCILYKDDSSKIAISITKFKGQKGFKITRYWKNGNVKRISEYDKNILPSGKWKEYYNNMWIKETGKYKNGKKTGTWKYYDVRDNGYKIRKVKYGKNGAITSPQKLD
ncbi:MAG: hypothetical protein ACLQQ4_05750 [Bacteroidia bacterium]